MANLRKKVPAFDLTRRKPGRNGAAVAGSTGDRDCVNNNDNGHLDNRPSIPKVKGILLFALGYPRILIGKDSGRGERTV